MQIHEERGIAVIGVDGWTGRALNLSWSDWGQAGFAL